jgi:hypothetical protein
MDLIIVFNLLLFDFVTLSIYNFNVALRHEKRQRRGQPSFPEGS